MSIKRLSHLLDKELAKLNGSVGLNVKFLSSNEIYTYNGKTQFWSASVIKIPIALTFYEQIKEKNINDTEKVKITEDNYVLGSGIAKLLDKNNKYTFKDLITLMLVVSDNTATNQIVDFIGWESVEKYMKEIGLENTTFKHKMMIKAGRGPNLTTPEEMTTLLERMYKNELPGSEIVLKIMQEQLDRTRIPQLIPNEIPISHKFGTLPEALHEVGIIYSKNPFIFCFFSDDQKDKKLTNEVLSVFAKHCFDYSMK